MRASAVLPAVTPALVMALALTAAACSKAAPEKPSTPATSSPAAMDVSPPALPPTRGQARHVKIENGDIDFDYAYPAQADAIPELKALLESELAQQKSDLLGEAKDQKTERTKAGDPYNALSSSTEWKVVADLPDWLSLSAEASSYEGGAHPNSGYDALLWDKAAKVRRKAIDLFTSKGALSAAIRQPFCAALDKQRAEKRGAPVPAGSTDEFDQCIDPADSAVILGSSNHRTFDRIGILIGPYEAGPYAEGPYEVTVPVTPAVLAAVKPEYRGAFSIKR